MLDGDELGPKLGTIDGIDDGSDVGDKLGSLESVLGLGGAEGRQDGVALGNAEGTDDLRTEGGVLTIWVGLADGRVEGSPL